MALQRLDAIATGIIATIAGGVLITVMFGIFWDDFEQARRQQEVLGTVVAQEKSKVCRQRPRGYLFQCLRWEQAQCPIVQYQPETGPPLKTKDCSLTLSQGMKVYVIYDRAVPTDAKLSLVEGSNFHWFPLLFTVVPLAVGGLLIVVGVVRLWQGVYWNQ